MTFDFVDESFEDVASLQDEFDDGSVDDEAMLSGLVEQGFEDVGEAVDRDEIEEACAPFEGMEGAEDGIEGFGIVGLVFEDENALLDIVEVLPGFGDELPEQVAVVGGVEVDGVRIGVGEGVGPWFGCGRWGRGAGGRGGFGGRRGGAGERLDAGEEVVQPGDVGGEEGLPGFDDAEHACPGFGATGRQFGEGGLRRREVAQVPEQIEDGKLALGGIGLSGDDFQTQGVEESLQAIRVTHRSQRIYRRDRGGSEAGLPETDDDGHSREIEDPRVGVRGYRHVVSRSEREGHLRRDTEVRIP